MFYKNVCCLYILKMFVLEKILHYKNAMYKFIWGKTSRDIKAGKYKYAGIIVRNCLENRKFNFR